MNYNPYTDGPQGQGMPINRPPIDFERYLKLLRKNKYYIILSIIIVTVLWTTGFLMFFNKVEYTSSTIIKFDDPRMSRGTGALTEFAVMDPAGKTAILRTRSFLERVVKDLNYNWIVKEPEVNPANLILSIRDPETAEYGEYKFLREGNRLDLLYSNNEENIKDHLLDSKTITPDSVGYYYEEAGGLLIDVSEIGKYEEVVINHIPIPYAIDILDFNLWDDLDRTRTILTLSYVDKNAEYAALVVNAVANLFVQQLLDHKRIQTSSILRSLQTQLNAAKTDLNKAENTFRRFRESNPLIFLSSDRQLAVSEISAYESDLRERNSDKEIIDRLTSGLNTTSDKEERIYLYQEIIGFLQARDVSGIDLIITQYQNIQADKQRLLAENISTEHVQIQILDKQLQDLRNEVDKKLLEYNRQLKTRMADLQSEINQNYADLKKLPGTELKLAELERNRQIKNDVVSRIMGRIEEAKVSDAAVLPEAYIIDKAKAHLGEEEDLKKKLMMLVVGPLLGLALAIFSIIGLDLLDGSVKSAKELEAKTKLKILASIPVIINENIIPEKIKSSGEVDPKLITSDYAPVMASEQFRFIRTKMSLENQNGRQGVIVTSLGPGDGKSLVASNLAVTFAQQKNATILLDCDLRRGILHKTFNGEKKPGMTDLLTSADPIGEDLVESLIQETHVPNLFLISSGTLVPNPSELLSSQRMWILLDYLKENYKTVIFDTPPIGLVPDAMALNSFIHNILLVARERKTNLKRLTKKLEEFAIVEKDFKYIILNASKDVDAHAYDAYTYYNY